jgi:DNA-binding transcriptional regulator YiaG
MDEALIEKVVAKLIIQEKVPIRGVEFHFLRKVLGLSLGRIGAELGISAPAVLKWERAPKKRFDRKREFIHISLNLFFPKIYAMGSSAS